MKLTGQKLKEKRESLNLTISEVSLATKINPKVLNSMESGDLAHLPAKTFLRGFVRAYSAHLKMNVDETLALFSKELGEVSREAQQAAHPQDGTNTSSVDVSGEASNSFRMLVVGGIVVLIVLIIGTRSLMQKYERERATEVLSEISSGKVVPLAEPKASEKIAEPKAGENKDTDKSLTPPPAAETASSEISNVETMTLPVVAATKPEGPKVEVKPAEIPAVEKPQLAAVKAPAPKASPAPLSLPKTSPNAEAEKPAAKPTVAKVEEKTVDEKASKAKSGFRHEIILEALDKVDVKFELNGQTKKISLAPNQVHTIVSDGPLTLEVSDGGAINITDNGRDKGTPGDLGHPKQVKIP